MSNSTISRPVSTPFGARSTAEEVLAGLDLSGRHYLITGGASGLGAATVAALASAGANVTIAARRPELADALVAKFPLVDARAIDLADLTSVRAFVEEWSGPLDAIIANAGVMAIPELQVTTAGWEQQLATNYLGHFALITGLHHALSAARSARVVTVSSGAQLMGGVDLDDLNFDRRPYDPWAAYAQSKSAVVLLAVGISRRWAADGITANSMAPGFIHTNLQRHVPPETMKALGAMDEQGNIVTPDYYKSPEEAASTIVLLAASPLVDGASGIYFEDAQEAPVVDGGSDAHVGVARWSIDPDSADTLWDLSAAAVNRVMTPGKNTDPS